MFNRVLIALLTAFLFSFTVYENYQFLKNFLIDKFIQQAYLEIDNEIKNKKSSLKAIALALSEARELQAFLPTSKEHISLSAFSKKLRQYTKYKNIWFKITDLQGKIFYSTIPLLAEKELKDVAALVKRSDIVADCYGLHIVSGIKLNAGYLLTYGHFNSIQENLKKLGILSTIIVPYPKKKCGEERYFGGFVLSDKEPHRYFLQTIEPKILQIIRSSEPLNISGNIVYSYPIKNNQHKLLGYIIFAKSEKDLLKEFVSRNVFLLFLISFVFILFFVWFVQYFYSKRELKAVQKLALYYTKVLDELQEIVLITDGKRMKFANKIFFQYFHKFQTLEDFFKRYKGICDLFVDEKGFIAPVMDGKKWVVYLVEHSDHYYYAKIEYEDNVYVFRVKAAKIDEKEYVVVFSDVSREYNREKMLEQMALRDSLTGFFNRHTFEQVAREKIEEVTFLNDDLLFVMMDLDNFKKINDRYGHDKGDMVLKELSKIIRKYFRSSDPIFRMGGEEFLAIVETKDIVKNLQILEKMRKEIELNHFEGLDEKVTISIGVAQYKQGDTVETLYKRADEFLYQAKRSGKNRIIYEGERYVG